MPESHRLRERSRLLACSLLLLAFAASTSHAAQRRYWIGVHDFMVPQVDSDTFGVNAGFSIEDRTPAGQQWFIDLDGFWDKDRDKLDPERHPIWWTFTAGTDGELWKISPRTHVDWAADLDTRANTASSIERQLEALPALAARFDGDSVQASLKAGFGYLFLEIDDDAPRLRGYGRESLRNTTWARLARRGRYDQARHRLAGGKRADVA